MVLALASWSCEKRGTRDLQEYSDSGESPRKVALNSRYVPLGSARSRWYEMGNTPGGKSPA